MEVNDKSTAVKIDPNAAHNASSNRSGAIELFANEIVDQIGGDNAIPTSGIALGYRFGEELYALGNIPQRVAGPILELLAVDDLPLRSALNDILGPHNVRVIATGSDQEGRIVARLHDFRNSGADEIEMIKPAKKSYTGRTTNISRRAPEANWRKGLPEEPFVASTQLRIPQDFGDSFVRVKLLGDKTGPLEVQITRMSNQNDQEILNASAAAGGMDGVGREEFAEGLFTFTVPLQPDGSFSGAYQPEQGARTGITAFQVKGRIQGGTVTLEEYGLFRAKAVSGRGRTKTIIDEKMGHSTTANLVVHTAEPPLCLGDRRIEHPNQIRKLIRSEDHEGLALTDPSVEVGTQFFQENRLLSALHGVVDGPTCLAVIRLYSRYVERGGTIHLSSSAKPIDEKAAFVKLGELMPDTRQAARVFQRLCDAYEREYPHKRFEKIFKGAPISAVLGNSAEAPGPRTKVTLAQLDEVEIDNPPKRAGGLSVISVARGKTTFAEAGEPKDLLVYSWLLRNARRAETWGGDVIWTWRVSANYIFGDYRIEHDPVVAVQNSLRDAPVPKRLVSAKSVPWLVRLCQQTNVEPYEVSLETETGHVINLCDHPSFPWYNVKDPRPERSSS